MPFQIIMLQLLFLFTFYLLSLIIPYFIRLYFVGESPVLALNSLQKYDVSEWYNFYIF